MKKVGIMQPYFFPYPGYFSLIKNTDQFVLFDPVQFIRHGWIERNRILKQNEGWLYIKVPLVKHDQGTLIQDICIDNTQDWAGKIKAQLAIYKKIAPFYWPVMELVNDVLAQEHKSITELNKVIILAVCDYIGIKPNLTVFSEMNLEIDTPQAADEWALNISKALQAEEYWNPPGGESFFDREKYNQAGIKLVFQKPVLEAYDQRRQPFEAGLSILDMMMFNAPEKINEMLDSYELG